MHTVCHVIKRLEKLAVDHAYQIIQRGIRIRDTAEKGNFLFAHAGKVQFIGIGQLGDLRQVKGCQTDADTDQDGLSGLSRDKLSRTFSSNSQKIHKKRCQKHRMASDTSFDRLHFSVQQVFAEIHIVWQLVDIWLPAPLDFRQFQRIGCFQRVIVARHI